MAGFPPRPVGRPPKPKTFRFKRRRGARIELPGILQPKVETDLEGLTGFVRGYVASDIEERFARALIKMDIGFWFQYKVDTAVSLPEYEKRVDFVTFPIIGKVQPVEVYGQHWHTTAGDRARDTQREIELNNAFERFGWEKLIVIWERDLVDQVSADSIARRYFA